MFYASLSILFFTFVPEAWLCQCSLPLYFFFFYSVSCLCSDNVLCLFICIFFSFAPVTWFANVLCLIIFIFLFFCVCVLVLPLLYASLFIFYLSFVSMAQFCQCSMLLDLYCFLFFFMSDVLILPMLNASFLIFFFSFVFVARFCKCSKPLYLYCILQRWLCFFQNFMPLLMLFSFLLRMWLGLANVLCLFICFFFLFCVSLNVFSLTFFCNGGFVYLILNAPYNIFFFSLRMWLGSANVLCLFICIFFLFFCICVFILSMLFDS